MIKSLTRPAAFMLVLTSLTSWLFVKSRQTGHDTYDNVSQLLTLISRLDVEINAEVLKLEFHLHKNYDRLTMLEKTFAECVDQLDSYQEFAFSEDVQTRQQLLTPIARKQELVTDFKALHAILENSVSIFNRASRQFGQSLSARNESNHSQENLLHLERAAMELVLKASPNSLEEVEQGLAWLQGLNLSTDQAADRNRHVSTAHARNLLRAKPQMDQLLHELDQLSVPASIVAMQDNATRMFSMTSQRAARYQMQLLCATLLLIGYGGYSIQRIGRYVATIKQANELLEDRVRIRTRDLEAKTEVLRSNGRFLSSVLDAMDAKICILDADGTIHATNAAWRESAESGIVSSGENYFRATHNSRPTNFGSPEVVQAMDKLKLCETNTAVVEFDCDSLGGRQCTQARINKMMAPEPQKLLGFVVALIDITERVHAQEEKDKLNRQLQSMSRQAGMAEVATGVLHNVGNVLNSINIASNQATRLVRTSRLSSLQKADELVQQHLDDFANFVAEDARGRQIPKYISQIAKTWEEEQALVLSELAELTKHIEHVKHVINVQQEHAKIANVTQAVQPCLLLEDALATVAPMLRAAHIELIRDIQTTQIVNSDPHKIMQIMVNLLSNAKHAVLDARSPEPCITLRAEQVDQTHVVLSVTDNGVGIAPENLARICQHGFTTKKNGHGFGLHSCALLAKELGGELGFTSPGVDCGATFSLKLPVSPVSNHVDREFANVDC